MKKQKTKTIFVIVCFVVIIAGAVSLFTPSDKDQTDETTSSQALAETKTTDPVPEETTDMEETQKETSAEAASTEEVVSTEMSVEEIEHRTGDEIIGISDKDFDDLHSIFYNSVIDDVTGKWRLAVISENVNLQDYIFSYYQKYFKSDDEIHGIVNLGLKVTTRITKSGDWLLVSEYDYVDGEEHDAKLLYSGTPLQSYIVYTDNGDIESAED